MLHRHQKQWFTLRCHRLDQLLVALNESLILDTTLLEALQAIPVKNIQKDYQSLNHCIFFQTGTIRLDHINKSTVVFCDMLKNFPSDQIFSLVGVRLLEMGTPVHHTTTIKEVATPYNSMLSLSCLSNTHSSMQQHCTLLNAAPYQLFLIIVIGVINMKKRRAPHT